MGWGLHAVGCCKEEFPFLRPAPVVPSGDRHSGSTQLLYCAPFQQVLVASHCRTNCMAQHFSMGRWPMTAYRYCTVRTASCGLVDRPLMMAE